MTEPKALVKNHKEKAKHSIEYKLFQKLQREHGYMMRNAPKSRRRTMIMTPKSSKVETYVVVELAVPPDSALGRAIVESWSK